MTGKFFIGDLMKNITSSGLPRATEPQVTDLGDTCLFKYLQLRDPLTVCIWRPLSQSQALGEHRGVAGSPSMHGRHRLRSNPRTQGHFKERAGAVKFPFPFYSIKAPPLPMLKYGEPRTQADGKNLLQFVQFKFPGTAESS